MEPRLLDRPILQITSSVISEHLSRHISRILAESGKGSAYREFVRPCRPMCVCAVDILRLNTINRSSWFFSCEGRHGGQLLCNVVSWGMDQHAERETVPGGGCKI